MIDPRRLEAAKDLADDYYYDQQVDGRAYDEDGNPISAEDRMPADNHFAEGDVVWAMKQIDRLLAPLGLHLHGFSPGVSARDEKGGYVRFDERAWRWLEHILVDYHEMREFVHEAREFVRALEFGDASTQLAIVERCRLEAREVAVALSKLRHRLASALTVRGDERKRPVARLLRDIAQWHRASGDSALCEHEADALEMLADQLGGLSDEAAKEIDARHWEA